MELNEKLQGADLQVEESIPPLVDALEGAGFRSGRSFELRSACTPLDSPCPHHGLKPCNCQLVVLMVYDWFDSPYSLTIHGTDHRCDITLVNIDSSINCEVEESIHLIIEIT